MKDLKRMGKALTKAEQKTINGGLKHCNFPGDPICGNKSCCQPYNGSMYCFVIGYTGTGCLEPIDTSPYLP